MLVRGLCTLREAGKGMLSHPSTPMSPMGYLDVCPGHRWVVRGWRIHKVHKARGAWGSAAETDGCRVTARTRPPPVEMTWLCPDGGAFPRPAFTSVEYLRVHIHR